MYSIFWHIVQYCNNLLAVSSVDFRLTEHAEWILEQRNGYKIFTRKLEGMYILILNWECKDNVKIDFTGIESYYSYWIRLALWERVRWITFEFDSHLQKKRIYTVSIEQVPAISEIDTVIEFVLWILWGEHGSLDKRLGK
jgi:hypothetical protein